MAMKDVLLDTNAYVAFKRGIPEAREVIRHAALIGINSIVLGELLAGFAVGSREAANIEELKRFMGSAKTGPLTGSSFAIQQCLNKLLS